MTLDDSPISLGPITGDRHLSHCFALPGLPYRAVIAGMGGRSGESHDDDDGPGENGQDSGDGRIRDSGAAVLGHDRQADAEWDAEHRSGERGEHLRRYQASRDLFRRCPKRAGQG